MTDKLTLYNLCLHHLARRKLKALTDPVEARRVIDDVYDHVVMFCLERKPWNFVYRTVKMDASSTLTPAFGFLYAFPIPNDWIRTHKVSAVETLDPPLLQYREEGDYWYANLTPLYVQYNSLDATLGLDLGRWPASFTDWVALRLARMACKGVTGSVELLNGPNGIIREEERAQRVAAANAALNDPVGFAPRGSWTRSRRGFQSMMPGPGGDSPTGGSLVP